MANKYNKYAYTRIKSEVPLQMQVVMALLMAFVPFFVMAAVANEKAPKPVDVVLGTGVLLIALGAGGKFAGQIAATYDK